MFNSRVPDPTAHMQTLDVFESELFLPRTIMSKSLHLPGCLDTSFCVRGRKLSAADSADSRCEHFSRHDETIDGFTIAQFIVYQEI